MPTTSAAAFAAPAAPAWCCATGPADAGSSVASSPHERSEMRGGLAARRKNSRIALRLSGLHPFMLTGPAGRRRMAAQRAALAVEKIRGSAMHSALIGIRGLVIFAASFADAATIAGTVSGPDGTPLRAAFVQARHAKLKMTVSVLSDNAGRYLVENLPAGDYRLSVRAIGYKAEPKSGITLAAEQHLSHDFALQPAPVRWTDLTILQGLQLLPDARGKQTLFDNCLSCHGFQSKMAALSTDEDG